MAEASWLLHFSPESDEDIKKLPNPLKEFVGESLKQLEKSPKELGKPGPTPPYRPGYQVFEFDKDFEGAWHRFIAFFKYGKGNDLQLHMLGHIEYANPEKN